MQNLIMAKKVSNKELELKEAKELLKKTGEVIENPFSTAFNWISKSPKRMALAIIALLIILGLVALWFMYIQPTISMLSDTNKNIVLVTGMLKEKRAVDSVKRINDSLSNALIIKKIDDGFKNVNGNLADMINYNNTDFKTLIKYMAKNKKDKQDLENDVLNDHNYIQKKVEKDALEPKLQLNPKN